MMTSNIISRFLPPAIGSPSVYETLRQHDQLSDQSDLEERAGMALDEENLAVGFQDYDLDDALADAATSQTSPSKAAKFDGKVQAASRRALPDRRPPQESARLVEADDLDDEVPLSLLIEGDEGTAPNMEGRPLRELPPPIPGPVTRGLRAQWQATQEQQRLHQDPSTGIRNRREHVRTGHPFSMIDPKERAMWRWANVENLDNFLKDVYDYFLGNGIWCILLSRVLNLL